MTISKAEWDLDVRVRERNLKNGTVKQEDVDKVLAALPDRVEWTLLTEVTQPAVGSEEEEDADDDDQVDGDADPG